VRGRLRDVLICHCVDCRRWHGHACAMTSARREDMAISDPGLVRWFTVAGDGPRPRRGFCATCGASLFWERPDGDLISIAAGVLDAPTGLATVLQIHVDSAADYYSVDPAIPQRSD